MAYTSGSSVTEWKSNLENLLTMANPGIAGSTTPISLTWRSNHCGFVVWVDWNNNLTFETSERVL
jgi:hypothetical protein